MNCTRKTLNIFYYFGSEFLDSLTVVPMTLSLTEKTRIIIYCSTSIIYLMKMAICPSKFLLV